MGRLTTWAFYKLLQVTSRNGNLRKKLSFYSVSLENILISHFSGSIEIWSFHPDPTRAINNACWYVERRIPGAISRKVETLVWCRRRLFASGTSGLLIEFDAAFNVAREIPASAGGVVAMVANEELGKIALASIDGTIVIYDVEEDGLVYDKTMEKRRERIMSLAWHADGNVGNVEDDGL